MFEKLKSLFIVEEEEPAGEKTGKKPPVENPSPSGKAESGLKNVTAEGGQVQSKFVEVLFAALEKANLQGFDYMEFKQSLRSLEKMQMDEATRFQSAMAMAEAMGTGREQLIESAKHYLKVLQKEEQKFKQALQKQQDQKVLGKQKELQRINEQIAQKEQQLNKLRREIEEARKKAKNIEQAVVVDKQKIEATAKDFMASLQALSGQIAADVEKMKQYLK